MMDKSGLRRAFEVSLDDKVENPSVVFQSDLHELESFRWFLGYVLGDFQDEPPKRLLSLKEKVDKMIADCYLHIHAKKLEED